MNPRNVVLCLAVAAELGLASCARHPLPDLDLDDTNGRLIHGDDDKNDEPDDGKMDPDPQEAGDGDHTPVEDSSTPDPEPMTDAGSVDPNDRTPAPTNVPGCPSTVPKVGEITNCLSDKTAICVYGQSYNCYCPVAVWVCVDQ